MIAAPAAFTRVLIQKKEPRFFWFHVTVLGALGLFAVGLAATPNRPGDGNPHAADWRAELWHEGENQARRAFFIDAR